MLLDTNAVSSWVRGAPEMDALMRGSAPTAMSAVTAAELLFGVARRSGKPRLAALVSTALETIPVLPWTLDEARTYGTIKANCERHGRSIGALDLLIAAHAVSVGARLVTRDRSFANLGVAGLAIVEY